MGQLTIHLLLAAVSALAAKTDALDCYTCLMANSMAECNAMGTETCPTDNVCGTYYNQTMEDGKLKSQVNKYCVQRQDCPPKDNIVKCVGYALDRYCYYCCDSDECDAPSLCPNEEKDEPCQNGGTCIGGDTCDCPSGFVGDHCQNICIVKATGECNKSCGIGSREIQYYGYCPPGQEKCCKGPCPSGSGGNSAGTDSGHSSGGNELCRDYPPYRDQV